VNFAGSLLCGVIYAQLPRQVKVDKKGLFTTITQVDKNDTQVNYYCYYIIRASQ